MKGLTAKQQEIFDYLQETILEENYVPTLREIADHFGFRSVNSVQDHLGALEKKGYIHRRPNSSRGIELDEAHITRRRPGLPIIGRVAAGAPITAVENLDGYLALSEMYDDRHYALHVRGDSMIDDGIWDGDFVIVREQNDLRQGEIGVAIVEGEATVKRIRRNAASVTLVPANQLYQPIEVDLTTTEFRLGGKVVGIHRVFR